MAKKRRSRQFKQSSRVIDIDEARVQRLQKRRSEKDEEERERTAGNDRRIKRKRALRKKQSRRRLLIAAITTVLLIVLCASVINIVKLKNEQSDALKKQEQLQSEQKQLKKDLQNINDEQSIEDKAREKLKLIKPGETIYIPDESTDE
jgi:cell division protein DivIC